MASRTASLTKFSEAINSSLEAWRSVSSRMTFAISGSTSMRRFTGALLRAQCEFVVPDR